jgi:hypothetical protein
MQKAVNVPRPLTQEEQKQTGGGMPMDAGNPAGGGGGGCPGLPGRAPGDYRPL